MQAAWHPFHGKVYKKAGCILPDLNVVESITLESGIHVTGLGCFLLTETDLSSVL